MSACVSCLDTNPMTRIAGVCHSNAVLEMRWFSRMTLRSMVGCSAFPRARQRGPLKETRLSQKTSHHKKVPSTERLAACHEFDSHFERLQTVFAVRIKNPSGQLCVHSQGMNCPTRPCTLSRWATRTETESRGWLDTARMCSTQRGAWTRA